MQSSPNISIQSIKDDDILISKIVFPTCWENDNRMDVLFSPFRVKTVNPENYVSKLQFWKDMINKYCIANGSSEINLADLRNAFKRNGKYPYCLKTVIDEMQSNNEIIIKNQFMENAQHTWSGWAVELFLKKPIKWSFTKVKESIVESKDINPSYIVTAVVKKQSDEVLNRMEHISESLISFDEVLNKVKDTDISSDGLKLCIHLLNCLQKVFVDYINITPDKKKMILKFAGKDYIATPITKLDRSIYGLEETEKELLNICYQIQTSIKDAEKETRSCLKDGKKQLAKTFLKKKHAYEKSYEKRSAALENVQILLSRIQDVKHDSRILQTYKLGTDTLQAALAESGITINNVADTLDDVKDLLELHDEISTVMFGTLNKSINDDDLERELNNLLNEDIPVLPECPNTSITDQILEDKLKKLEISKLPA